MPVRNSKYDHIKVYRPTGTLSAHGKVQRSQVASDLMKAHIFPIICDLAIKAAIGEFYNEFKRWPNVEKVVIELVTDSIDVHATILEIPNV